jgi:hypothetical protein
MEIKSKRKSAHSIIRSKADIRQALSVDLAYRVRSPAHTEQ